MTILEIESFFGDCMLSGPELSREELEAQLNWAYEESGESRDVFLKLLEERFGWKQAETGALSRYRYDLDIEKLFIVEN